jgi:hypothetical protein
MNALKRASSFFKDYLIQSVIYFIIQLSPLGSTSWKLWIFEKSLIEDEIDNFNNNPIMTILHLLRGYAGFTLAHSLLFAINIYILNSKLFYGDEYTLEKKVIALFLFSFSYLLLWMVVTDRSVYTNLTFPIFITTLLYLLWFKYLKKKDNKKTNDFYK